MNAAIQHYQLHLALLDIQTLEDIAVRIEEGATSDVMEILAQNVGSINERQGIDVPPMDVLSVEAYKERAEIALEGITASLSRIWNAIYTSIGNLVTGLKNRFRDSVGLYENRIKELQDVADSLSKMDQKATFTLEDADKLALRLCDSNGTFSISDAGKNLENFSNFLSTLVESISDSTNEIGGIVKRELSKGSLTENPFQVTGMDLSEVARLATKKTKTSLEYSFGGTTITVEVPNDLKVTVADYPRVSINTSEQKLGAVRVTAKTATVADAAKMVDACIKALRGNLSTDAAYAKMVATMEELSKQSGKFRESAGMVFLSGAKTGLQHGFRLSVTLGLISLISGATPLVALALVATQATTSAVGGGVGAAVGVATNNKAAGTVAGFIASGGTWGGMIGAATATAQAVDKRRKEDKLSKRDEKFLSDVQKHYSEAVRALTEAISECTSLGLDVMILRETVLDSATVALTRIARAALKAETKA